jgi:hypothetical protein
MGDHRHVIRRHLDGGRPHAGRELALGVGRDGLIPFRHQEPGRVRLPGRHPHHFLPGGRGQGLLHGVHDPGLGRIDVRGEVMNEVVLGQPGEARLVDVEVGQRLRHPACDTTA